MKACVYKVADIGSGSLHVMAKPTAGLALDNELASLYVIGIDRVVSLLESGEQSDLGLDQEEALVIKHKMEFVSFPITDMELPESVHGYLQFTKRLHDDCLAGLNTVVHCRAGIGRSGIIAAGVLLHDGFEPLVALEHISTKRTVPVPDTQEQIDWVVTCHSAM